LEDFAHKLFTSGDSGREQAKASAALAGLELFLGTWTQGGADFVLLALSYHPSGFQPFRLR
jgi:hypothetical protein